MFELSQPEQTDYKCTAFSLTFLECTGKSAWLLHKLHTLLNKLAVLIVLVS